jgi:hypothetical protein
MNRDDQKQLKKRRAFLDSLSFSVAFDFWVEKYGV